MMDRRKRRLERRLKKEEEIRTVVDGADIEQPGRDVKSSDDKFAKLLTQKEDVLLNFVAKINKLYQETLGRPAPFVSFVICGMQSSGKSTIMERFLNAPLNIVQEGTGTRCPLDTTCIHDSSLAQPKCELWGEELDPSKAGDDLTTETVFAAITEHNKWLGNEDRFSTKPLNLVYRASNVQNMRFVDTPGIIANEVSYT
jgi:GTP1/Obg family GTP-binding protein